MNIFKTNYRRVREGIMQSVGAHQVVEDVEFDARVLKFQQLVRDMERVHEAVLVWSDCVDALSAAGAGLGDTMSKFFNANSTPTKKSDLEISAKAYLSVQADINETLRSSTRKALMDRCIRPMTEVLTVAPLIQEKLAVRKQLKLDSEFYVSKYKTKISAGKDESDPEVAKVAAKMRDAEKALADINDDMNATFDELEEARSSMLIPELSSLVGCQYFFLQTSTKMLADVISFFPQAASTMCALHADSAAAPYMSKKVVENLRATSSSLKSARAVAVIVADAKNQSPAAHHATSHQSLSSLRGKTPELRPRSEINSNTASVATQMIPSEKPRSVPLGSQPPNKPPPMTAPPMPPPKPTKKQTATESTPNAQIPSAGKTLS